MLKHLLQGTMIAAVCWLPSAALAEGDSVLDKASVLGSIEGKIISPASHPAEQKSEAPGTELAKNAEQSPDLKIGSVTNTLTEAAENLTNSSAEISVLAEEDEIKIQAPVLGTVSSSSDGIKAETPLGNTEVSSENGVKSENSAVKAEVAPTEGIKADSPLVETSVSANEGIKIETPVGKASVSENDGIKANSILGDASVSSDDGIKLETPLANASVSSHEGLKVETALGKVSVSEKDGLTVLSPVASTSVSKDNGIQIVTPITEVGAEGVRIKANLADVEISPQNGAVIDTPLEEVVGLPPNKGDNPNEDLPYSGPVNEPEGDFKDSPIPGHQETPVESGKPDKPVFHGGYTSQKIMGPASFVSVNHSAMTNKLLRNHLQEATVNSGHEAGLINFGSENSFKVTVEDLGSSVIGPLWSPTKFERGKKKVQHREEPQIAKPAGILVPGSSPVANPGHAVNGSSAGSLIPAGTIAFMVLLDCNEGSRKYEHNSALLSQWENAPPWQPPKHSFFFL